MFEQKLVLTKNFVKQTKLMSNAKCFCLTIAEI